ncbi:hypothetical protein F444_13371 [Phytophthora nicotianae P1976]|uniref:M96 mating-specific protein family n=1 Tax=Phytophthora nicotianae P1976 TaxID=1317066 RepID=A0A080ZU19_PHYNI|nr:hypothetical protein F444_13371 [Phytophthora nicotianae P1976]
MREAELHNASSSASVATAECNDILEAFLQDMSALDQRELRLTATASTAKVSRPSSVSAPRSRQLTRAQDRNTLETAATRTVKKKRLNPSWIKRKRELEALREETEALKTRVEFLRMKGIPATTPRVNEPETLELKEPLEKERQHCQAALEENYLLKNRLQDYVNLSGHLQTVLTAAAQQKNQLITMSFSAARNLRMEPGAGYQLRLASPSVFDMLEERVNTRFRELEASLNDTSQHVSSVDTELIQVYNKNGDRNMGTVEFKRAQLLPFQETAISGIIWSIVEMGGFPDGHDSRIIRRSEDVYAMDSRLTVCLDNGDSVSMNTHSVMKRFLTTTGTVLLLESNSDWTADLEDSGSWVQTTDEGGCFVIRSYGINGSRDPSDISQLHSELTLRPSDPSENARRTVNDVVIPSFREIVESRHQFVENALFDCLRTTRVV